jgi:hypothetical protein
LKTSNIILYTLAKNLNLDYLFEIIKNVLRRDSQPIKCILGITPAKLEYFINFKEQYLILELFNLISLKNLKE